LETVKHIHKNLLAKIEKESRISKRKRSHLTLHEKADDPVQRMVVAADKGTYIRPHRHKPKQWELFILLKGSLSALLFDDSGTVYNRINLDHERASPALEIFPETWHTIIITSPQAVFMEIKPGPYQPLTEQNFGKWSPPESSEKAVVFEKILQNAQTGTNVAEKFTEVPH
jgi:cupin fold WbuC family metalloprotein